VAIYLVAIGYVCQRPIMAVGEVIVVARVVIVRIIQAIVTLIVIILVVVLIRNVPQRALVDTYLR
jgi:hypothetical protein